MCYDFEKCCCFSLKKGVIFIGIFDLITSIIGAWKTCGLNGEQSEHFATQFIQGFLTTFVFVAAIFLLIGVKFVSF